MTDRPPLPFGIQVRREPVQRRSAERLDSLLDAAAALIDEKGIDALTTSDVAARAGSSVGVVYRYFRDIEALVHGLARRNLDRLLARIEAATQGDRKPTIADDIDALLGEYVAMARTEPAFRVVRVGDSLVERQAAPPEDDGTLLMSALRDILERRHGLTVDDEVAFELEIMVHVADGLLRRAFLYDRHGDDRFVERLRTIVRDRLSGYETRVL